MHIITGHDLVAPVGIDYSLNESALAAARKWADGNAGRNAAHRLIATCELIAASMSVVEQPAMHKRLLSDIEGLKSYLEARS